jgi:uncharacterized protein YuzE
LLHLLRRQGESVQRPYPSTTKQLDEGVAVDYDSEGHIAGIEILDAIKRLGTKEVFRKVTLEDLVLQA